MQARSTVVWCSTLASAFASPRRHGLELGQARIEVIPAMSPRGVGDDLRLVAGGLVEACCADGEDLGHRGEGHVDRQAALDAETARLHVAAVTDHVPVLRLACHRDAGPREGEVRAVAASAFPLAVPALAVIAEPGGSACRLPQGRGTR